MKRKENIFNRNTLTILTMLTIILMSTGCISQKSESVSQNKSEIDNDAKFRSKNTNVSDSSSLINSVPIEDTIVYNQYVNMKKEGIWREFHKKGQLKSEGSYSAGLKEGLHKEWQNDGTLVLEGFYKNGKATGLMKWYWEGNLVASGNMKENKRHGLWTICDYEIQSNCIEASFKEDKKVGVWKIMHDNGKLAKEQYWKEGNMVSERCWDENGQEIKCE